MRWSDWFDYDPELGILYWKNGRPAGHLSADKGYYETRLKGKLYYNHRIIWEMIVGEKPKIIDHIDRDRTNNRIENLRNVTQTENLLNTTRVPGVSGYVGVWKKGKKFQAMIKHKQDRFYLGLFETAEEASLAYNKKKEELNGPMRRL